jgi:2-(1,2-epoxy-1,2-dihydrophenyl)acetyl-CoA isomerase
MDHSNDLRADEKQFTVQWAGPLAILRFGRTPLYFSTDLSTRDELLAALQRCHHDPSIRVVLLIGFPEKAGSSEYEGFLRQHSRTDMMVLHRMLNIFNQLIVTIVTCPKFFLFVDGGTIISQFFNVGLACDYRLVGDNTIVQKTYLRHGLIPKGGATFFLAQLLGRSRAFQLLLAEEDLTAQQALAWGIVDEIAPAERLEEVALSVGQRLAAKPVGALVGLKRLLNYPLRDLEDYLAFEREEFLQALRQEKPL